jgi:hypothetical protein
MILGFYSNNPMKNHTSLGENSLRYLFNSIQDRSLVLHGNVFEGAGVDRHIFLAI